jgi:DNA-binding FrmR family transcriptional regulator
MAPKGNKEKEKEKERRTVCVAVRRTLPSWTSVSCGSCSYWYHKTCAGMTEDVFKCVDQHFKDNGSTFWNCQPCATYAKGITARLREMEGRLEAVEKNQEEQDEKIVGVEKKVSIINRALQKRDERVEEIVVNKVCVRGDQRAGDAKEWENCRQRGQHGKKGQDGTSRAA